MKNTDFNFDSISSFVSAESFSALVDFVNDFELEVQNINCR